MRFAERFLVLLALIALIFRLTGSKDGPTLELIAMPLLAAFYLVGTWFLIQEKKDGMAAQTFNWQLALLRIACAIGTAYCIISLMLYTIGWLPRLDMIENCGLILLLLSGILGLRYKKKKNPSEAQYLLRIGILALSAIIAFLLPFGKR